MGPIHQDLSNDTTLSQINSPVPVPLNTEPFFNRLCCPNGPVKPVSPPASLWECVPKSEAPSLDHALSCPLPRHSLQEPAVKTAISYSGFLLILVNST